MSLSLSPILIYASAVWWSGAKWQEEQMGRVQNLCLRMICAVFKTSPIYALEIEAAIPPIAKVLDKVDRDTAARLHKLGPRSPVLQRLPALWSNHREGERETFFLFRLCEQATYIIRAQDTVTALLQVQTIEGVGQLGGLKEL